SADVGAGRRTTPHTRRCPTAATKPAPAQATSGQPGSARRWVHDWLAPAHVTTYGREVIASTHRRIQFRSVVDGRAVAGTRQRPEPGLLGIFAPPAEKPKTLCPIGFGLRRPASWAGASQRRPSPPRWRPS